MTDTCMAFPTKCPYDRVGGVPVSKEERCPMFKSISKQDPDLGTIQDDTVATL